MIDAAAPPIVLVAFDGVTPIDVTGPATVFAKTKRLHVEAPEVIVASPRGGTVRTNAGVAIADTVPLADLRPPFSLILIAGGDAGALLADNRQAALVGWLRAAAPRAARVGSVCTGAFVLAEAGLLDGRRATTHWNAAAVLGQLYPRVQVEGDAIHVIDGPICTSAGVTAGMDLALALVEADFGSATALRIAREMVLFLRRQGGQSQFSTELAAQSRASSRLQPAIDHIVGNPGGDCRIPVLAATAAMSERNFARRFAEELGQTPASFVANVRLDHARRLLETTTLGVEEIAALSGFGGIDTLQQLFRVRYGTTPRAYRARFSSVVAASSSAAAAALKTE